MNGDVRLDIGDVLGRAWDIFVKHWKILVTLSAIIYVGIAVIGALLTMLISTGNFLGAALVGALGAGIVILGSFLLQGMYVLAVDDISAKGESRPVGELLDGAKAKLGALVTTSLLAFVGIVVGLMLLIVPGIILAVFWMFAAIVVMLEDKRGTEALKHSREVVRGNGWVLFGLIIIVNIAAGIVNSIVGNILGNVFGGSLEAMSFARNLGGVVTGPFVSLVPIVAYFTLTRRGGVADAGNESAVPAPAAAAAATPVAPPAPVAPADPAPAEVAAPVVTPDPTPEPAQPFQEEQETPVAPQPTDAAPSEPAPVDDLPSAPSAAEPAEAAEPAPPAEDPDAPR